MKKNYLVNILLAGVLGIILLAMVVTQAFFPAVILPKGNIPNLVLVSLIPLVLEHYLAPGAERRYPGLIALAVMTFGLLPYAAGLLLPVEILRTGLAGGLVFAGVTWLFDSITDRISSGPAAKVAPLVSAVGLYLACQILNGIL